MNQSSDRSLDSFATRLAMARESYAYPPNLRSEAQKFLSLTLGFLFPHFSEKSKESRLNLLLKAGAMEVALNHCLGSLHLSGPYEKAVQRFLSELPGIYDKLILDGQAIFDGDPAAESLEEVIMTYPGFYAIAIHRIAHVFYQAGVPLFPRLLSELAHQKTGIDIHPGAQIGSSFFIDHGTGIVIGETAIIGDRVKIFQGVTLGALCVDKKLGKTKRHPTIEDDVVIYACAVILGGQTVVGARSTIGGNVWLTESVPPGSLVTRKAEVQVMDSSSSNSLLP